MFPKFGVESHPNRVIVLLKQAIMSVVALVVAALGTVWFSATARADFVLVTPVTIPGDNPGILTPVLRFQFDGIGPLSPITEISASLVNDPSYVVFDSKGELFVSNRHGNVGNGVGSISRLRFDQNRNLLPNGTITGNSLESVNGLAFSASGELWAANFRNGTISRFVFDEIGNASANGYFSTGELINQAVAFSASGELFSTHDHATIRRWSIDPITKGVIANGAYTVVGASRLHGLIFSRQNELFVADAGSNLVFRLHFDGSGNLTLQGSIPVSGGPLGLAFSPTGELFVTSHFTGGITRFTFDAQGNAIQNGPVVPTNQLGGAAILTLPSAPPPVAVPEPGTFTLLGSGLMSLLGYVKLRRWRRKL